MIHHISLDAKNPKRVASVLAEIMGGRFVHAPPNFRLDSWVVLPGDEHGTMVEVLPLGTELRPDQREAGHHTGEAHESPFVPHHAYISVDRSPDELLQIATREDWLARRCNRGPFELIECWIENRQMIEFASPEMKAKYLQLLTNPEALQAMVAEYSQTINKTSRKGKEQHRDESE